LNDSDNTTLATLVATNPAAARVFEQHGLDYCCHGQRTLAESCRDAGLEPETVGAELARAHVNGTDPSPDITDPVTLAGDIVDTHHRYLHEELPPLDALADKVLAVHGERHPELAEVRRLVAELRTELEPHLLKEECILFPAIEAVSRGRREFPFGSVANPIRMMTVEHDRAGEMLHALRQTTGGYASPADACASYRSLYERLAALELDTHLHIHKENNVLFPAVLALTAA
jgi:regulator of cell morphogenesis and NO signaling